MVQNVEDFGAELEVQMLAQGDALADKEVQIFEAGPCSTSRPTLP